MLAVGLVLALVRVGQVQVLVLAVIPRRGRGRVRQVLAWTARVGREAGVGWVHHPHLLV